MAHVRRDVFDQNRPASPYRALAVAGALALSVCLVPLPALAEHGADGRAPAQAVVSTRNEDPVTLASTGSRATCGLPAQGRADVATTVARVNAERRAMGLGPLRLSGKLSRVAQAHACDNAARNIYSHFGSDGSDLRTRLRRAGYALRIAAENTGIGFTDPLRAMAFWMRSPYHRDNILNPRVTEIGIGLAHGSRPNWVMVMATGR